MGGDILTRHPVDDDIFIIDHFLTPAECEEILAELDVVLWRRSLTYERQPDDSYKNVLAETRISETAHQDFFNAELVELLEDVEGRLEAACGIDRADLEWWQATRYRPGGLFDYHLDAGYWDDHYAGDRILTFLLYLDAPEAGGATHFRARNVEIEPQAGRLLVWRKLFDDGTPNHQMIHSGSPVVAGEKTILVTWERQRPFRVDGGTDRKELIGHE
ncbi:MAG: 2OG-Fe(II) oxygenase [Actinomycetota bacterium]|nr:2OG-Fe(II) oxygenase [Actinomycetota bacterium]